MCVNVFFQYFQMLLFVIVFQYFSIFFNVFKCLLMFVGAFKSWKCYHSVQKDVIHEGRRMERLDEILEAENINYNIIEQLIMPMIIEL